jgi:methylmalonyl-CoA/ethylmalonyl-CoA epimerase
MTCVHVEVNEEQGVREAMMEVGHSGSYVQLLSPLDPDTTIGRFLDKNGPGIQQMAYRTDDLDALSEHLRAEGMKLLYDEPRTGTAGSRVNFIHPKSAGGVLVELVEPAPGGLGH